MEFKQIIGEKLREMDWTYEDLARAVGVSGVYISQIAQGKKVPSDNIVIKLARVLDIDLERMVFLAHMSKAPAEVRPIFERLARPAGPGFLQDVDSFDNIEPAPLGHARPLPVVGLVRAGAFSLGEDGQFPPGVADEYVYTDTKGHNLFGVKVEGDSMTPDFRPGDILVVNPNLEPRSGDYVIARIKETNEATFKKLVLHPPLVILRPLNSNYQDIVLDDTAEVEFIGKVVERKTIL